MFRILAYANACKMLLDWLHTFRRTKVWQSPPGCFEHPFLIFFFVIFWRPNLDRFRIRFGAQHNPKMEPTTTTIRSESNRKSTIDFISMSWYWTTLSLVSSSNQRRCTFVVSTPALVTSPKRPFTAQHMPTRNPDGTCFFLDSCSALICFLSA